MDFGVILLSITCIVLTIRNVVLTCRLGKTYDIIREAVDRAVEKYGDQMLDGNIMNVRLEAFPNKSEK